MTSSFIKAALAVFVIYIIGDYVWHTVLLGDFYFSRLSIINDAPVSPSFPPFIVAFEAISALVTARFIPRLSGNTSDALVNGGLLGLVSVGAVNFVNHSMIAGWDLTMVAVDTTFGVVLAALAGVVAFRVARK